MNIKILTGTTFAALLGVLAVSPAIAQNTPTNDQMQAPSRELLTPAGETDGSVDMNRTQQMQMDSQQPTNNQTQAPSRELLTPAGDSNRMMMDGSSNQRTIERRTVDETQIRRIQTTPIQPRPVQTQQYQSQPAPTNTQFNNIDTTEDTAPVRGLW